MTNLLDAAAERTEKLLEAFDAHPVKFFIRFMLVDLVVSFAITWAVLGPPPIGPWTPQARPNVCVVRP